MIFSTTFGPFILNRLATKVGSGVRSISIYSGSQPTATAISQNWADYRSSNSIFLAHFNDVAMTNGYALTTPSFTLTTPPTSTVTPINNGTAAWAIIWGANNVNPAALSIPATGQFIVVPVTTQLLNGVVRFADVNILTTSPLAIADIGLTLSQP